MLAVSSADSCDSLRKLLDKFTVFSFGMVDSDPEVDSRDARRSSFALGIWTKFLEQLV